MKNDVAVFLSSSPLFRGLTHTELTTIIPTLRNRSFVKNQLLFSEGELGDTIYLIQRGELVSTIKSEGREIEVARFRRGDFLGELSFFDNQPRSASCSALKKCEVVTLTQEAYATIEGEHPTIGATLLRNILCIIADRLQNSDLFLADMVLWGEDARRRSITDEFTTLFNRRHFDHTLPERLLDAKFNNEPLTLGMIDIDHFGKLNQIVGATKADRVVLSLATILRRALGAHDIPVRYGGDEFSIILRNTDPARAETRVKSIVQRFMDTPPPTDSLGKSYPVTISIGIATYPYHAHNVESLLKAADDALYEAKERGRNTVAVATKERTTAKRARGVRFAPVNNRIAKHGFNSLAARNRVLNNIVDAIVHRNSFMVLGHKDEDDDCVAAMVAVALLIKKFNKEVALYINFQQDPLYDVLKEICRYNHIPNLSPQDTVAPIDTVVVCDTPRPDMINYTSTLQKYLLSEEILNIEIDHHTGSNSRYAGNQGYCLVDEATSSCELIYLLGSKLQAQSSLIKRYGIGTIFTRNLIFALLTGMMGDTQNGRYVHGHRNQKIYKLYTNSLNTRLGEMTFNDHNVHSTHEINQLVEETRTHEQEIMNYLSKRARVRNRYSIVTLNPTESSYMWKTFDNSRIRTVARTLSSDLGESVGTVGVVLYDDNPEQGDGTTTEYPHLIRGHMRRCVAFKKIDLREVLTAAGITDGGGHEGAVGFRIPYAHERTAVSQRLEKALTEAINSVRPKI